MKVKEESKKVDLKLNIQKSWSCHDFLANINRSGKSEQWQFFYWAPKSLQMLTVAMKLKMLAPWKESNDKSSQHIKNQTLPCRQDSYSQSYGFSSSHVQMWEMDHKEDWVPKNWCFQIVVWRRFLRVLWTARRKKSINPKGSQSWIFIGRTDTEVPILLPPDMKSWFFGKDPDAEKDWALKGEGGGRRWDG